jgi:hypothetical protein
MYAIYLFTLMGEATILSNKFIIGTTIILLYLFGTSCIIYAYERDLFRTYIVYMPIFIFYISFVCYQIEKSSKINYL